VTVPGSNLAYPLASGMVLELDSPACNAGRDSLANHRRAVLSDTFLFFAFFELFCQMFCSRISVQKSCSVLIEKIFVFS
jgi:hypothetical protein